MAKFNELYRAEWKSTMFIVEVSMQYLLGISAALCYNGLVEQKYPYL